MLLELLIAMVILVIGLGGLMILLVSAMYTNNKAGNDTTSTMVAEHILEQITSQHSDDFNVLPITDCAGTTSNISTASAVKGAGSGSNGGNGANLTANGTVDWTQAFGSVPAGYAIEYAACGTGGHQLVYDIRWNVIKTTNNPNWQYSRMVIISARPKGSLSTGGLRYAVPVNLRTIGGM
jgi:type II secretory pathway pseudopilin PulG